MRIANIINVILQSLGFISTVVAMVWFYIDNRSNGQSDRHLIENESIIVFVGLLLLGGYQLIHAFVMSILKLVQKKFNWLLGIYWILSLLYVISLLALLGVSNFYSFGDEALFSRVFAAWIPVIYYLVISIIDLVKSYRT